MTTRVATQAATAAAMVSAIAQKSRPPGQDRRVAGCGFDEADPRRSRAAEAGVTAIRARRAQGPSDRP
jgi:hypothetical protein